MLGRPVMCRIKATEAEEVPLVAGRSERRQALGGGEVREVSGQSGDSSENVSPWRAAGRTDELASVDTTVIDGRHRLTQCFGEFMDGRCVCRAR